MASVTYEVLLSGEAIKRDEYMSAVLPHGRM